MKYKQYQKMKDSGVEWIGEIPEHWEIYKISHLSQVNSGGTPSTSKEEFWNNGNIPWVNSGEVQNCIIETPSDYITELGLENSAAALFPKNTVVIALTGATAANVGILDFETSTNQSVTGIFPSQKLVPNFLFFQLISMREEILKFSIGSAQPHINQQIVKSLKICLPPFDDQEKIYDFLQKQTAQFDDLISKSQSQINFLQEKRQGLINHAVTKGLDPTVPMKDSGMAWIGEIPEKWDIYSVRYLLNPGKSGIRIGPFGSSLKLEMMKDDGFKIYGQENVINDDFSLGRRFINEEKFEEMKQYEIIPDDIVITMMGTTGKSKVVPENIQQGIMDSHLVRMRVNQKICDSKLFSLVLNDSNYVQSQLTRLSSGSIMQGLNSQIIKSIKIILPSLSEQKQIYDFTQKGTTHLDNIISKSQSQINFLQEKRQALITAAVTGKIDVRNGVA